jgi:hypothetical protein
LLGSNSYGTGKQTLTNSDLPTQRSNFDEESMKSKRKEDFCENAGEAYKLVTKGNTIVVVCGHKMEEQAASRNQLMLGTAPTDED